jgi:PmbA protein
MFDEPLLGIARSASELGVTSGATQIEAYAMNSRHLTIQTAHSRLDWIRQGNEEGIGIRALLDGRLGFAYSSKLTSSGVHETATAANAAARESTPDAANGLPSPEDAAEPNGSTPTLELAARATRTTEEKVDLLRRMEAAARSIDPRVQPAAWCTYSEAGQQVAVANSLGLSAQYHSTYCYCRIQLAASDGSEKELGYAFSLGRGCDELDAEATGAEAGRRAMQLLHGQAANTGRTTVVFDPLAAAGVLAQLARLLTGEALFTGQSPFASRASKNVAWNGLTLTDDPFVREAPGSRPFDAEGVSSRRTRVIECGTLVSFIHNIYSANRTQSASTANAYRTSYRAIPEVAPSNLVVSGGREATADLIEHVEDGVLLTMLQGTHAINPYTGAFSIGGSGIRIHAGRLTSPLREVTVAADFSDFLRQVVAVGDDVRVVPDKFPVVTPTLFVEGLTVGGN